MKRFSFVKRGLPGQEVSLQITSMADIFTIILVFLLKSYAAGTVSLTPSAGMILPKAFAGDFATDALKVEILRDSVQLEGRFILGLTDFSVKQDEAEPNGSLKTAATAFEQERKRQIFIASRNADVKLDPRLIVLADQRAPYATIKAVLASAAIHGYTDFKLAVIRGD